MECFCKLLENQEIYYSLLVRDKMHDAKDIILSQYQDMPSLHEIASMVGTNECTLKKAFKYEFGTTVFQFLFDYRMRLAAHYQFKKTKNDYILILLYFCIC